MSGIMFNGVEMKNGEDKATYIKRVFDKMNLDSTVEGIQQIINDCEEKKETKKEIFKKVIDDDLSDSDETLSDCSSSDDEALSDSDTEIDEDYLQRIGLTYFKRVMLGTYDCSMEEHDDAVKWFNNKYGTEERGSNGSKGHYFTHGENPYNLFKMKKLKSLYDRKIKSVTLYNIKVHVTFINPTTEEIKTLEEYNNVVNNFRSQRDTDRYIDIKNCEYFMNLMEHPEVENKRDYNHQKSTHKYKWKVGDVVFNYANPYLKFITFWQVIKVSNKMLKVKPLQPIVTVRHINNDSLSKVCLVKYKKDNFIDDVKSKYLSKHTHNTVYIIEDYIYRMFKQEIE